MSGILHSILLGRPNMINMKLARGAATVSALVGPSPDKPYLRIMGGGLAAFETNGIVVTNVGLVNAEVRVVIDTPFGTFIDINTIVIAPGNDQILGGLQPLAPGQSRRIELLSSSPVGAKIDVTSMWSDIDVLHQVEHELGDELEDVLVCGPDEILFQVANSVGYVAVMALPGPNLLLDLRVIDEDGNPFDLYTAENFPAGFYEGSSLCPIWLKPGQRLQARKTAGAGVLTLNIGKGQYVF